MLPILSIYGIKHLMERIYTDKPAGRKRNRPLKDYAGIVFGRLTAIILVERDITSSNNHIWKFRCECGVEKNIRIQFVRNGNTSSCGCLARELLVKRNTTHGKSRLHHIEYKVWKDMRTRCSNINNKEYHNYGERGIVVCDRWKSFANFLEDMGSKPSPFHSLDRIDVNGNYEPSNCRWADIETQANNKRCTPKILFNGEEKTMQQWCRALNIEHSKVAYRLSTGKTLEESFAKTDYRKGNSPVRVFTA